jgi:hypothetical protein
VATAPGIFALTGWALDPQRRTGAAAAEVLMDGRRIAVLRTFTVRPDVNNNQRVTGAHGFRGTFGAAPGRHTICINALPDGTSTRAAGLGCRAIVVPQIATRGAVQSVAGETGSIAIHGWAWDPRTPAMSNWIRVGLDSRVVTDVRANVARADVNRLLHLSGAHGFAVRVAAKAGKHTVCVWSLPTGSASVAKNVGCKLIIVS